MPEGATPFFGLFSRGPPLPDIITGRMRSERSRGKEGLRVAGGRREDGAEEGWERNAGL